MSINIYFPYNQHAERLNEAMDVCVKKVMSKPSKPLRDISNSPQSPEKKRATKVFQQTIG